jgi:hypothetical protein
VSDKPTFSKGDWVVDTEDDHSPLFGRVKEVWSDGTIDVFVYAPHGEKIGRRSPACGGPKGYEPCLTASRFALIEEPAFPLKVDRFTGRYTHLLKRK